MSSAEVLHWPTHGHWGGASVSSAIRMSSGWLSKTTVSPN